MGMPTPSMISMAPNPPPMYRLKNDSGIITMMMPDNSRPNRNHTARSPHTSVKAKRSPALIFSPKRWWLRCTSGRQFRPSQQPSTGQERSGTMGRVVSGFPSRFSEMPAAKAVTKAATGRTTVMMGSIRA